MSAHTHATREGSRGVRAFAHVYSRKDQKAVSARFEGYIASGATHTGIGLTTDDDTAGIQFFAGLSHVACGWFTIGSPSLSGRAYRRWGKSLPDISIAEVRFHDRGIWWQIWHDKWNWKRGTPKWRHGNFHWWDFLVGKPKLSKELVVRPTLATVPMPEGGYQATVKVEQYTYRRARWPWPKIHHVYDLDVISRPGVDGPYTPEPDEQGARPSGYIPVPGKGENAWDCGPDGVFSMFGPGRTIEKAIGDTVAAVLRDRRKNGASPDYAEPIS